MNAGVLGSLPFQRAEVAAPPFLLQTWEGSLPSLPSSFLSLPLAQTDLELTM